jgi:Dolichyl-phosphate-mannose-protein mannosyltransferase
MTSVLAVDEADALAPGAPRSRPWRPSRQQLEALAIVTTITVAVVLRLWGLDQVGLNSDESVYAGQGAAMFGTGSFDEWFSLFRAHPLAVQATVGFVFQFTGASDFAARATVALLFGVGSVVFAWAAARELYGRRVALIAVAFLSVMPYHVLVSRQVLVDTGCGFFFAVSLFALARSLRRNDARWLLAAVLALGGAVLAKEIAVIFLPGLAYLVLRARRRGQFASVHRLGWLLGLSFFTTILPFPLTRLISKPDSASSFVLWQFTRKPNHSIEYFGRALLQFGTPVLAVLCVAGGVMAFRRRSQADVVVLVSALPGLVFFTLWPTKLFPYVFPLLPLLAVLAALALERIGAAVAGAGRSSRTALLATAAIAAGGVLTMSSVTVSTLQDVDALALAGFNDYDVEVQTFAGAREFSRWAGQATPEDARFLTIGPSLGNILRFYGDRDSVAMSVSTDPKKRNPAYVPIPNPDLALRRLAVHYLVWDAYSADRTLFYSERLLRYARRFGGIVVFSAYVEDGELLTVLGPAPQDAETRVVVYDIPGGSPVDPDREQLDLP